MHFMDKTITFGVGIKYDYNILQVCNKFLIILYQILKSNII